MKRNPYTNDLADLRRDYGFSDGFMANTKRRAKPVHKQATISFAAQALESATCTLSEFCGVNQGATARDYVNAIASMQHITSKAVKASMLAQLNGEVI